MTEFNAQDFVRLANNFYNSKNVAVDYDRIALDADFTNYINQHVKDIEKKYKVALVCICLNPPYWPFAQQMIEGARKFFLPGHQTDIFLWSDIPKEPEGIRKVIESLKQADPNFPFAKGIEELTNLSTFIHNNLTVFPTESMEWPLPTLMRYHLMLQQEEKLVDYDYIFYIDVDMAFVNVVGDEILSKGLTAAPHPGYFVDKKFIPPYEPNEKSAAFIKRPGLVIEENGKPRFLPFYAAGGFQGGKADVWIKAMKEMREMVNKDSAINYIPIWNDESIYNRYLFDNPPVIYLTPSYVYPDSLVDQYYKKIWGCNYHPKLVTLTKKFSTNTEGGKDTAMMLDQLQGL